MLLRLGETASSQMLYYKTLFVTWKARLDEVYSSTLAGKQRVGLKMMLCRLYRDRPKIAEPH